MPTVRFPQALIEQLQELAHQAPDREICGLVGAINTRPTRIYPVANVAENPQRHFLLDGKQQIETMRQMRDNDETLFAIYHSHPNGSPEPSQEDIEKAAYPNTLYLIISLTPTSSPEINGYYIRERAIETVAISAE